MELFSKVLDDTVYSKTAKVVFGYQGSGETFLFCHTASGYLAILKSTKVSFTLSELFELKRGIVSELILKRFLSDYSIEAYLINQGNLGSLMGEISFEYNSDFCFLGCFNIMSLVESRVYSLSRGLSYLECKDGGIFKLILAIGRLLEDANFRKSVLAVYPSVDLVISKKVLKNK